MSMADRDGKIWKDGKLVDWRDANLHMLTHSLHYGMAVFEGVRAYKTVDGTAIFRLREHTQRLFNSAKIFQMAIPFDMETLIEACQHAATPSMSASPRGLGARILEKKVCSAVSASKPPHLPVTT